MASESKSLIRILMLPVVDVMMILTIGFLATGGYLGFLASSEESAAAVEQFSEVDKQVQEQNRKHSELVEEKGRILKNLQAPDGVVASVPEPEETARQKRQLEEELQRLKSQLEELIPRLTALADKVRQLKEQADAYGRKTVARDEGSKESEQLEARLETLKAQKAELERKLASLEAQKAREEKLKPPVSLGVSLARPRQDIDKELVVVLSQGKLYPVTAEYYTEVPALNYIVLQTKKDGQAASQALDPGSPLMTEVQSGSFKRQGRVVVLVNSDSFATFRLLRDKLSEMGIDYAWEPWERGTTVVGSSSGATPLSQGAAAR